MKKIVSLSIALCMCLLFMFGCGNGNSESSNEINGNDSANTGNSSIPYADNNDNTIVRVGSLKGPTSIGLVNLMNAVEEGIAAGNYSFTMEVQADTLVASMIRGDIDIALVPANVASVIYNKTEGGICVLDINTLGVLYMISEDTSISSVSDLKGKTIYLTGQGTTPDFVLQYLLASNNLKESDVNIVYLSEATEVLNAVIQNTGSVALLPQPFATAAQLQKDTLKVVIDTTESWNAINGDNGNILVTGVTIAKKSFVTENPELVKQFMLDHKTSADKANEDVDATASLVVKYEIIEKEPVAAKAIPFCNITYIDGEAMKVALQGYLSTIAAFDSEFIGGVLPEDDFYYISE